MRRPVHYPVLLALALAVAGCGQAEAPAVAAPAAAPAEPAAPPKEEHIDVGQVKIDSGGKVALPANFPADIPLPPGAKLTDAITMGRITVIAFTVPTDPDKTFATLLPLYEAQGWKNYTRFDGKPVMASDGYDKDGRKLIYTVVVDDAGSKVNLRHYPAN